MLDTLLSFLPCRDPKSGRDLPITTETMLVVYASNDTLCDRANGMDDRVLRRHIARLIAAGLLTRRDSATGKRFPLRRGGRVIAAYGLDLTPLLARHDELRARADAILAEAEEARSVRAEALSIRAELLRSAERLSPAALQFVEQAKTILRRTTLGLRDIEGILAHLLHLARGQGPNPAPSPQTNAAVEFQTVKESGPHGSTVRQEETPKTDTDSKPVHDPTTLNDTWAACSNLTEYYPSPPASPAQLKNVVFQIGSFLGLKERPLARAITEMGWLRILSTLDYLVGHAARIKNPNAYLNRLTCQARSGETLESHQRSKASIRGVVPGPVLYRGTNGKPAQTHRNPAPTYPGNIPCKGQGVSHALNTDALGPFVLRERGRMNDLRK